MHEYPSELWGIRAVEGLAGGVGLAEELLAEELAKDDDVLSFLLSLAFVESFCRNGRRNRSSRSRWGRAVSSPCMEVSAVCSLFLRRALTAMAKKKSVGICYASTISTVRRQFVCCRADPRNSLRIG
jgi:hypothetical protein